MATTYLKSFTLPSLIEEELFVNYITPTCYNTYYPFGILSRHGLHSVEFEPVTIFYGSNGCGKSTALNVIAAKLGFVRETLGNSSSFFPDFVKLCSLKTVFAWEPAGGIITSDDVFDFMQDMRRLNENIDLKRDDLMVEYQKLKHTGFTLSSLEDYEELKRINAAKRKTQSCFVRDNVVENVREFSNGESALRYFQHKIKEDGLYLLDEPENSLSPDKQLELVQFLEEQVRFYGCQLIISTHSPFILAMRAAKIYNLDANPVEVNRWYELPHMRTYYEFFKKHGHKFED